MAHSSGPATTRRELLRLVLAGSAGAFSWISLGGAVATPAPVGPPPRPLPGSPPDKPNPSGIVIPPEDPAITARAVDYPGTVSTISGYLSAPAGGEIYPGVLVLHDADGLTEHVQDVTRRLAKAGYVALAPDLLSRMGGTPQVGSGRSAAVLGAMAPSQFLQDLNTSVAYLEARPLAAKSRIGVLGFGLGGALSWLLVARNHDLKAAVAISGGIPALAMVDEISAAVLAIFGDAEQRDLAEIPDLDAAMKKRGTPWAYKIEPKAGRGFFDDTQAHYVPQAAKDAWSMILEWYGKYL
jgi:carboxymethylenebutenolidase